MSLNDDFIPKHDGFRLRKMISLCIRKGPISSSSPYTVHLGRRACLRKVTSACISTVIINLGMYFNCDYQPRHVFQQLIPICWSQCTSATRVTARSRPSQSLTTAHPLSGGWVPAPPNIYTSIIPPPVFPPCDSAGSQLCIHIY